MVHLVAAGIEYLEDYLCSSSPGRAWDQCGSPDHELKQRCAAAADCLRETGQFREKRDHCEGTEAHKRTAKVSRHLQHGLLKVFQLDTRQHGSKVFLWP